MVDHLIKHMLSRLLNGHGKQKAAGRIEQKKKKQTRASKFQRRLTRKPENQPLLQGGAILV